MLAPPIDSMARIAQLSDGVADAGPLDPNDSFRKTFCDDLSLNRCKVLKIAGSGELERDIDDMGVALFIRSHSGLLVSNGRDSRPGMGQRQDGLDHDCVLEVCVKPGATSQAMPAAPLEAR